MTLARNLSIGLLVSSAALTGFLWECGFAQAEDGGCVYPPRNLSDMSECSYEPHGPLGCVPWACGAPKSIIVCSGESGPQAQILAGYEHVCREPPKPGVPS